jgi:hypothetical protein
MMKDECRMMKAGTQGASWAALAFALGLVLIALPALGQGIPLYGSSWAQQFVRRADAPRAVQFLGLTNLVTQAQLATNNLIATSTNAIYAQYATNWLGSNAFWISVSGMVGRTNFPYTAITNSPWWAYGDVVTNAYIHIAQNGTNAFDVPYLNFIGAGWTITYGDPVAEIKYTPSGSVIMAAGGIINGQTNVTLGGSFTGTFYGNGTGLSNVVSTTTGLTTNLCVVFCDATTNTLNFTNGLLVAINGTVAPAHCSSIILPGGGYLLQPSGGSLCLP